MRAIGLPLAGVAAATLPFAGVWIVLSLALGRKQRKLDEESPSIAGEKLQSAQA
jgi:hypothetical protein